MFVSFWFLGSNSAFSLSRLAFNSRIPSRNCEVFTHLITPGAPPEVAGFCVWPACPGVGIWAKAESEQTAKNPNKAISLENFIKIKSPETEIIASLNESDEQQTFERVSIFRQPVSLILERSSDAESERKLLLKEDNCRIRVRRIKHACVRVVSKNQPERHVNHRDLHTQLHSQRGAVIIQNSALDCI